MDPNKHTANKLRKTAHTIGKCVCCTTVKYFEEGRQCGVVLGVAAGRMSVGEVCTKQQTVQGSKWPKSASCGIRPDHFFSGQKEGRERFFGLLFFRCWFGPFFPFRALVRTLGRVIRACLGAQGGTIKEERKRKRARGKHGKDCERGMN